MTYPEELDTDDIEELASYIERRYPTEEIRIHDTGTIHFAYWDKSAAFNHPMGVEFAVSRPV